MIEPMRSIKEMLREYSKMVMEGVRFLDAQENYAGPLDAEAILSSHEIPTLAKMMLLEPMLVSLYLQAETREKAIELYIKTIELEAVLKALRHVDPEFVDDIDRRVEETRLQAGGVQPKISPVIASYLEADLSDPNRYSDAMRSHQRGYRNLATLMNAYGPQLSAFYQAANTALIAQSVGSLHRYIHSPANRASLSNQVLSDDGLTIDEEKVQAIMDEHIAALQQNANPMDLLGHVTQFMQAYQDPQASPPQGAADEVVEDFPEPSAPSDEHLDQGVVPTAPPPPEPPQKPPLERLPSAEHVFAMHGALSQIKCIRGFHDATTDQFMGARKDNMKTMRVKGALDVVSQHEKESQSAIRAIASVDHAIIEALKSDDPIKIFETQNLPVEKIDKPSDDALKAPSEPPGPEAKPKQPTSQIEEQLKQLTAKHMDYCENKLKEYQKITGHPLSGSAVQVKKASPAA